MAVDISKPQDMVTFPSLILDKVAVSHLKFASNGSMGFLKQQAETVA